MGEPTFRIPGQPKRVACFDATCAYRPCFWIREMKDAAGLKVLRCGRREQTGCPTPFPAPDPERVRCCVAPDFPPPGERRATRSTCRTCGRRAEGMVLGLRRMLPRTAEPTRCGHVAGPKAALQGAHRVGSDVPASWTCGLCRQWWDHEPKPFEKGEDVETFRVAKHRAWLKAHNLEETPEGIERYREAVREGYGLDGRKAHPKVTDAQARAAGEP